MMELYKELAIKLAIDARDKAILIPTSKTKVGACVYNNLIKVQGFNIQNKCHKSYHAEEIAILHWILKGHNPKEIEGVIVSFSHNDIAKLTFCCGHCRQILWETTENPELLVTEVDLEGNIIKEVTLGYLYNFPYPRPIEDTGEKEHENRI